MRCRIVALRLAPCALGQNGGAPGYRTGEVGHSCGGGHDLGVPVVRHAIPNDAEGIGEAHAEAWRIGYGELVPAAQLDPAVDLRLRMWARLIGDPAIGGTLLVAEVEGEVVGFTHFGPATENDQAGEVYGLYVHPSSWGTGPAQALMDEAVASLAESFDLAILWTHSVAGRARSFYTKAGWTVTGTQRVGTTWDGLAFPEVEYERILTST